VTQGLQKEMAIEGKGDCLYCSLGSHLRTQQQKYIILVNQLLIHCVKKGEGHKQLDTG